MKLSEKASYLQGLMDGLDIDNTTKEGKVLKQMADIMRELILSMEEVRDEVEELNELCDCLDHDLGELEGDYYGCEEDEFDIEVADNEIEEELSLGADEDIEEVDFADFISEETDDIDEASEVEDVVIEEAEEEFLEDELEDDELYEVICPTCNDTICITESILLDGSMECPNCGEFLEFDLGGDEFLTEDAE